jgi:hypothetical protein
LVMPVTPMLYCAWGRAARRESRHTGSRGGMPKGQQEEQLAAAACEQEAVQRGAAAAAKPHSGAGQQAFEGDHRRGRGEGLWGAAAAAGHAVGGRRGEDVLQRRAGADSPSVEMR